MQAIIETRAAKFSGPGSEQRLASFWEGTEKQPQAAATKNAAQKAIGLKKFLAALMSALSCWTV